MEPDDVPSAAGKGQAGLSITPASFVVWVSGQQLGAIDLVILAVVGERATGGAAVARPRAPGAAQHAFIEILTESPS